MMNRILQFYTRLFAVWIVLFGLVAYLFPGLFLPLQKFMDLFFSVTMFGIGAVLTKDDFAHILKNPINVLFGLIAQFTIMPFGALLMVRLFRLPPDLAVGLIIAGAAPDAMSGSVVSYIAHADVAYAVSLTVSSTLIAPVVTPGFTYLLANSMINVDFSDMFFSVTRMVILPLIAGYICRAIFRKQTDKLIEVFPAVSMTFIIFICSLVIALNKNYLSEVSMVVFCAVLALNLFGMALGYLAGLIFRMDIRMRRTLSITVGMQNAGFGTVLALKYFGSRAAIPTAVFVFVCIITASIMAAIWGRENSA